MGPVSFELLPVEIPTRDVALAFAQTLSEAGIRTQIIDSAGSAQLLVRDATVSRCLQILADHDHVS